MEGQFMKNNRIKIGKSSFAYNVFILATGTAAAQVVTMALSPLITRLYGPEAFGIMGTFVALISIITPIAALTFPIAIVLPKRDSDAKKLIQLSLIIALVMSLVTLLILYVFHDPLTHILNLENIEPYLYLIPFVILFASLLQVIEQWLIRKKQFSTSSKATFLQSLIVNGGKVGVGLFYPFVSVLVFFSAFNQGLKALLLFVFASNKINLKEIKLDKERGGYRRIFKEYNDFPKYRAPEVFLNAISQNIPVLLLTSLFGHVSVGFYTIGKTVLALPSQLIGKSVGDVFYPRFAEAYKNEENLYPLVKKATLVMGLVGLVPFSIVVFFGPHLFSLVFGDSWKVAGEYARWIALWSYFGFMNKPSVMSLPVLSAQAFHLKYSVFMLVTRIVALVAGYILFRNDIHTIAIFGIVGAMLNGGLIYKAFKICKDFDKRYVNGGIK